MVVAMAGNGTMLGGYRPIGGALCLDFANTVDWHDSDHPVELLANADCLSTWAGIAGAGAGAAAVEADEADLKRALELRDALWDAFAATAHGRPAPAAALPVINLALELGGERRLVVADGGVAWGQRPLRQVDRLLHGIARSAADLLTDPSRLSRVRMCATEGCGWLFLDESRGARRRWCSMQGCGNRAKGRAHYRRKAQAAGIG